MSSSKILKIISIILPILALGVGARYILFAPNTFNTKVQADISISSRINYELSLVAADLSMYDYLSPRVQQEIVTAMDSANRRFPSVPIGLMHAITRTESEYRFWIDHPTVNVNVKGRMVVTNARGMGGVIWDFWGDSLQVYGIAYNKSDLYLPTTGILAEACVLHIIIRDVMQSNPSGMGLIARVQSDYYGAYSVMYMSRMQQVTSDLWLKRMAKEIKDVYDTVKQPTPADSLVALTEKNKYPKQPTQVIFKHLTSERLSK